MGAGGSKGKQKKGKVTSHDQAVLDLKVQRDKLKQYQKRCELVMAKETEVAKQLLSQGKKSQALICLKKKKLQESMLAKSQAQLENVSTMIDAVEFAQVELKVFESLKAGNVALAKLHEQIGSVEDVENLMLDTEEAIERQNEIDQVLSQSIAAEQIDEAEIEAELDALEAEDLAVMPSVPTHALPSTATATTSSSSSTAAKKPVADKQKVAVLA